MSGGEPDERALVLSAQRGSQAAFGSLVRRHQAFLRAFLRRLCGQAALADDLAQETFMTAWQILPRYEGRSKLSSWLCGIGAAHFRDHCRAARRDQTRTQMAQELGLLDPSGFGAPHADRRLDLSAALNTLTPDARACLALAYGAEMSHTEVSEALGLPVGTVKSHIARARDHAALFLAETAS